MSNLEGGKFNSLIALAISTESKIEIGFSTNSSHTHEDLKCHLHCDLLIDF